TVPCAYGAQTDFPPPLVRIKAHDTSFLYRTGMATQGGDLKKQGGDNVRWKGPGSMAWNVDVEKPGEYQIAFCYASVEGAYGQELQIRSGDASLAHKLIRTEG